MSFVSPCIMGTFLSGLKLGKYVVSLAFIYKNADTFLNVATYVKILKLKSYILQFFSVALVHFSDQNLILQNNSYK